MYSVRRNTIELYFLRLACMPLLVQKRTLSNMPTANSMTLVVRTLNLLRAMNRQPAHILASLQQETSLPFAIGIAEKNQIIVRYSSMPYRPIRPMHTTIGNVHCMIDSAMGQVYLAFCNDAERQYLISRNESGALSEAEWLSAERTLQAELVLVNRQKYALRKPSKQHQNATLAVPVLCDSRILRSIIRNDFSQCADWGVYRRAGQYNAPPCPENQ